MPSTMPFLQQARSAPSARPDASATEGSTSFGPRLARRTLYKPAVLLAAAAAIGDGTAAHAAGARNVDDEIRKLTPALERYVTSGMAAFDVPGAAVGVVSRDHLLYAKGFGRRRKGAEEPVGTKTLFQIGSTTKAFAAAALALAVDRRKLAWNDRVVALHPTFVLEDPWVTREFRVFDFLAQRSGLPPYANDTLVLFGFDSEQLMHSLRFVTPVTSFRSAFTYTNITHLFAGKILAKAFGAPDWPSLAKNEILTPLGMHDTSFTAAAIQQAPDHAMGHLWTPKGSVAIPFTSLFPYELGPAGDINSNVEDCARWVRFQLGDGTFAGRRLVSAENMAVTHTPQVSLTETNAYAMGWSIDETPHGRTVWHNGGTLGFGAFIGFLPQKGLGIVVLTNQVNGGFPDAVGLWTFDKLLGNPEKDYAKEKLRKLHDTFEKDEARYRKPAHPQPAPPQGSVVGKYKSTMFGVGNVVAMNDDLVLTLEATGAKVKLTPFDGATFTFELIPEGRFAPIAAAQGETPMGFASFEADSDAHLSRLRLWAGNGQAFLLTKA